MRSSTPFSILSFALLAGATACERDDAVDQMADVQTDSGAIASAAAEAIVSTLRGTTLSDTAPQRRWLLAPGPTPWDTLLVDELRRAEPSISDDVDDTTLVTTVSTHGLVQRGDTADVTVVVRSCVHSDTVLNFSKDSLVHRLVLSRDDTDREWRLAGPVSHDHAVGECEPLPTPIGDTLNR